MGLETWLVVRPLTKLVGVVRVVLCPPPVTGELVREDPVEVGDCWSGGENSCCPQHVMFDEPLIRGHHFGGI